MQIQHLPTTEITIHPTAAILPKPDVESPQFKALCATILEVGIPRPIPVNGFRAVAELDVLAAARHLGFVTIPTTEVDKHDVRTFITGWIVGRNHYTKSQIAYLVFPFVAGILDESKARRVANLKAGMAGKQTLPATADSPNGRTPFRDCKTMEDVASAAGISRKLLSFAASIHKSFDAPTPEGFEDGQIKSVWEPRILSQGENGESCWLGHIVAGIAGYISTKGQPVEVAPVEDNWFERFDKMCSPMRWSGWDRLPEAKRAQLAETFWKKLLETLPEEIAERNPIAKRRAA